jgi:hypothetical protein
MTIISKSNMKNEEIEVTKKALLEILEELYKGCVIHCHYIPYLNQFFVYCYVDRNDDDAFVRINYDYEEALDITCDVTIS